ncbi:MAG TPA: polysaccharide biosynthesis tyrosine autokinase [Terriglobia bacterium]|nr:polysaccharide biosynthesis tyrosine autokinase [Terriglobia bacterium]
MDENRIAEVREPEALVRAQRAEPRESVVLDVAPEEVPHLLDYWELILKRRWLVLTCVLIVFTTVAIGTLKEKPVYEAKVEIEIDPEPPNVVNFKEVVSLGNNNDFESYQDTQYKLIQSRTLAEQVVRDLKLYENSDFIRPRYLFGLIEGAVPALPPNIDEDPPSSSSPLLRNAIAYFQSAVDVNPVRRSNLAEISFESHDPNVAATVANKLADDYSNFNLETKYNETMKASAWLKSKIADMKITVEKEDDKLAEYARANGIVFVSDKETLVTAHLSQVETSLTTAQNDLIQVGTLYDQVQAGHIDTLPGIIDNPLVQDLQRRKQELERQYDDLSVEYKPDYPKVLQVKKQIDGIDKQIERQKKIAAKTIVDQYTDARARVKKLTTALDEAKNAQNDLAEKTIQYDIIKRESQSNHDLYDGLLTRMKEANVSAGLGASNIRVIDPATVPLEPVKPRVLLNLTLGLILGLGLGVGLAFFQEYLDKTLKTPDDVEQYLRLPSLGVLPRFAIAGANNGRNEEGLLTAGSNGHVALAPGIQTNPQSVEAFRSLRTSVLLSASPVPRLILVTSALPSEGKTTTTVNLGATLASLGNRVVVVDCDMRRPACHRSTGVENHPGFVQCLTGHVDLKAALLPVPGVENLSVIPCGPIPPNPAEVLSSPTTADLLRNLRAQFEYVLVDSPPLLSVADSRILATLVDAVVLVARAHATPYDVVRRARTLLYGSGARILGVALNDMDIERHSFGSQQYQYGYGYGYGSEQDDVEGSNGDRA